VTSLVWRTVNALTMQEPVRLFMGSTRILLLSKSYKTRMMLLPVLDATTKRPILTGMNLVSGGIADSRGAVMGAGVFGIAVGKDVSSVVFGVGSLRG
jgi:hypothetical protein